MQFHKVNSESHTQISILYDLLDEREHDENISHKEMPSFAKHMEFVKSEPYKDWYIVSNNSMPVGSCYISKTNELGVAVFKRHRGHGLGQQILEYLIRLYSDTEFLANINPNNKKSIKLFEKVGFKHIQNTYQLLPNLS